MIAIRRARFVDAPGIAAVHVATWRSAYATLLPDSYLASLSVTRLALYYEQVIHAGRGLHVAAAYGRAAQPKILGFALARRRLAAELGDGEVEMLYVLDDYRDQGLGGRLLRAAARYLAQLGCRSAYAWVLSDNPACYFYERLGGKRIATSTVLVAEADIPQTAFAWDPIGTLLDVNA